MRELTEADFANSIKNPFYERLVVEVTVPTRKDAYNVFKEISDNTNVPVETLMSECISDYAKKLAEFDD